MRRCRANQFAYWATQRGYATRVVGAPPDRFIVVVLRGGNEVKRFIDLRLADRWLREVAS